ncbi:hypothetical protein WH50_19265 [Pokkaliibacter plantistimulans]|uniref:Recombinase RecA n=1 Tax=Pokkaliibacter plantistimulans TaxID=1635171 RepID=A0ABX5LX07_9GAMM|nr:translesion DNA synthesis-associated protein ImuA [Pokkaliibacter plantistimulans]PXF29713.1 hypothetical protein WH50_19265 [Pokkaliibacter plantistimulans]
MNTLLSYLENHHLIWRGRHPHGAADTQSSGYAVLDEYLQGGFPRHDVIEIDSPCGIGELRLLLPYLQQQETPRLLVFIAPPGLLSAELLLAAGIDLQQVLVLQPESDKDALWAAEQCLKSGSSHGVVMWHRQLDVHQLKRLQLAAQEGRASLFLFRTAQRIKVSLPVALSLQLRPHAQGLRVRINKRRGGWAEQPFTLDMSSHWPELACAPVPDNLLYLPVARAI